MAIVGGFAKTIFDQINDLFTDRVGPVSVILEQEALDDWMAELKRSKNMPRLQNICGYVERLASQIDSNTKRKEFVARVYKIDALSYYKHLYAGT